MTIFTFILICFFAFSCSSQDHKIVLNPEFPKHVHAKKFKNIYESKWSITKYDKIDFLKPDERKKRDYRFWSHGEDSPGVEGIDMTHGYDSKSLISSIDWKIIKNDDIPIRITWIGHASFLISFNKTHILTDPMLHNLPMSWLFDRLERAAPPVMNEKDLDFVSLITISHNHYDHLNWETLSNFNREKVKYLVPLRTEQNFSSSYKFVAGMDWYTNLNHQGVKVHFVPVQHWTKRTPWDRNEELWGGWIFEKNGVKIFFAGDTGYSKIFTDIRKRYGDMDVCLMPITAFRPYRYRRAHLSPEMAIDAAKDMNCKVFIPWGYGTFTLGHEHVHENLRRLRKAYDDYRPSFPIKELKMGETMTIQK